MTFGDGVNADARKTCGYKIVTPEAIAIYYLDLIGREADETFGDDLHDEGFTQKEIEETVAAFEKIVSECIEAWLKKNGLTYQEMGIG